MLVLTRYATEAITLDLRAFGLGIARVEVCSVRGNRVKLGVVADARIRVDREEIFEEREGEGTNAKGDHP